MRVIHLPFLPTGSRLHRYVWQVAILILAVGCGSHQPGTVASVGKDVISRAELDAYVRYVADFDALAYPDSAEASCARAMDGPVCGRVRRQALVRLIQERLVHRYARSHRIRLGVEDRDQIDTELDQVTSTGAPTFQLFRSHAVTRRFMRQVLVRQLYVQKVQTSIAGTKAQRGFELHIRRLTIPVPASGDRREVYQQAVSVATGGALPDGTIERVDWVAPFRLPAALRAALRGAGKGDFVGPFVKSSSYLLVQLLGAGIHRYGAPARQRIETRVFHQWLHRQARQTRLRCLNAGGRLGACPAQIMKSV